MARTATFRVATNNIMSLPENPHPFETLNAAPRATVVMAQECDKVHELLKSGKLSRTTHDVPNGSGFASFVLYSPAVWDHVSTEFFIAYKGRASISLTRHIAVSVLRHKGLDQEFAFISYHSVTSGRDRIRDLLRGQGDAAVRKQIRRFKAQKIPVIIGADMNRTRKVFISCTTWIRHHIDAIYAWKCDSTSLEIVSSHTVGTASDHRVLVAEFSATVI